MKILPSMLGLILFSVSFSSHGGDIAFGTLKGIKVYDYSSYKVTKLYFGSDATHLDESSCQGVADITHSLHDDKTLNQMVSVALAAYMSGKKVRAYSQGSGSCEADLVTVQNTYF